MGNESPVELETVVQIRSNNACQNGAGFSEDGGQNRVKI